MPTENRSSNTEMVSVPRVPTDDMKNSADGLEFTFCTGDEDWQGIISAEMAEEIYSLMVEAAPAPQPHPEPIAWMVGTAIWWTKEEAERDAAETGLPIVGLGPMAGSAPAQEHQGEPVMRLECEKLWGGDGEYAVDFVKPGWLQECRAKGGTFLLYTHADPGEVERLLSERKRMDAALVACSNERDALRAELRKQDALLDEAYQRDIGTSLKRKIRAQHVALSASAEPSAPAPMPAYMEAACDKFDWTPEEALRFYAEGKHFDIDRGRTRILCTGAIASHALKGMGGEYADMKGIEPSAPVEIDCDALVAAVCVLRSQGLGNLSEAVEAARLALELQPS